MLIVTKSQVDALSAHFQERFVQTMLRHLREQFPERAGKMGEEGLRTAIDVGSARARKYGLVTEQDVAGLIHFGFETVPDFDGRPEFDWAVAALSRRDLEPGERVDLLYTEWRQRQPKASGA